MGAYLAVAALMSTITGGHLSTAALARTFAFTLVPIAIGYHEAVRILAAWCELRKDFRSFRTDRVVDAVYHDEKYPERRDLLRAKWRHACAKCHGLVPWRLTLTSTVR